MELRDYMKLPYTRLITKRDDEDGIWYFGEILEFQGCYSDGETIEELNRNLDEVMELWLTTQIEDGETIPLPVKETDYSGKFLLRIPKTLHRRLSIEAEREGVSLNQYAVYKLSAGI